MAIGPFKHSNMYSFSNRNYPKRAKGKVEPTDTIPNWKWRSQEADMTEQEIRDHITEINWKAISNRQKLSESFMREYKDNVNWKAASNGQTMTEDFIRENIDKINWKSLLHHFKFREEFLDEIAGYLDRDAWECLC